MAEPKPFIPRPLKITRRGPMVERVVVKAWPQSVELIVNDNDLTPHDARRLALMLDAAADDADAFEWADPTDDSLTVVDTRKAATS